MGANSDGQGAGGSQRPRETTAYYLGQFFGHIVRAVKADVTKPAEKTATTVRTQVDEAVVETNKGPVTLRRTTIDEVDRGER